MRYTAESVLVSSQENAEDSGLILEVTPQSAGWEFISFQARRLDTGGSWTVDTEENEFALVNMSGRYRVENSRGTWEGICGGGG